MATFSYAVADFVAFTKIKSADVNSRFNDIKAFFNGLNKINLQTLENVSPNGYPVGDATGKIVDSGGAFVPFFVGTTDPSTPASNYLRLYSKNQKLYTINSAGAVSQVGSGAGGGGNTNYVTNPDAEADTTGWTVYKDAFTCTITIATPAVITKATHGLLTDDPVVFTSSGTLPTGVTQGDTYYVKKIDANTFNISSTLGGANINTTGTQSGTQTCHPLRPITGAGTSPVTTLSRSTSSPLRGSASFLWAKDASDRAGEGLATPLAIDATDQGKVLTVSFDYRGDTNILPGDISVWIYDVTNGVRIPVSPSPLDGGTLTYNQFIGEFQTNINSQSYKLLLHISAAGGSSYNLKFDSVSVGPAFIPQGTPITDWQSYSVNVHGSIADPTKGTVGLDVAFWRRVGDSLELRWEYQQSAAGSAGNGDYSIPLPPGLAIDTAKLAVAAGTAATHVGTIKIGGGTDFSGNLYAIDSTHLGATNDALSATWGSGTASFGQTTLELSINTFLIPIAGWSSNLQMSGDADTRVVAAQANSFAGGQTVTANVTDISFSSIEKDTHSAWTGTTFIAPVEGFYQFAGSLVFTTAVTGQIHSYINAVDSVTISPNITQFFTFSGQRYLKVGDILSFRSDVSGTIASSSDTNSINISRVSGPSQIAASELVAARYYISSNYSSTVDNQVNFDTKDFDTHNSVTTGSGWKFTCPISGVYRVSVVTLDQAGVGSYRAFKNLVEFAGLYSGSASSYSSGSALIKCLVGDLLDIRQNGNSTIAGDAGGVSSHIGIERLGF